MATKVIDYDRGVVINTHKEYNIEVYMYKDDPGVYLSAHGTPVSNEVAQGAGFDIEKFGRLKLKKERMNKAMQLIEKELDTIEVKKDVVEERGGLQLVDIGLDRFQVIGPDGEALNKTPLSREQGSRLLKGLAPDEAPSDTPAAA